MEGDRDRRRALDRGSDWGAVEEALRNLRDDLAAIPGVLREYDQRLRGLEQRMASCETRIKELRGVRATLYGPDGQDGLVGDVRDLKREAARTASERGEVRTSLLWPFIVAVLSATFSAVLTYLLLGRAHT